MYLQTNRRLESDARRDEGTRATLQLLQYCSSVKRPINGFRTWSK